VCILPRGDALIWDSITYPEILAVTCIYTSFILENKCQYLRHLFRDGRIMCLTEENVWKYIVRYVAANCCVLANTTRESGIYPWLDFSFVPCIFAPYKWGHWYRLEPPHSTNVPSQGRVGASSNPPGTNASHLYRVVTPPSTNVRIAHSYRVGYAPVQMWHLYRTTQPPGTSLPPRALSIF
jgi:hypothetical protein